MIKKIEPERKIMNQEITTNDRLERLEVTVKTMMYCYAIAGILLLVIVWLMFITIYIKVTR